MPFKIVSLSQKHRLNNMFRKKLHHVRCCHETHCRGKSLSISPQICNMLPTFSYYTTIFPPNFHKKDSVWTLCIFQEIPLQSNHNYDQQPQQLKSNDWDLPVTSYKWSEVMTPVNYGLINSNIRNCLGLVISPYLIGGYIT